MAQENIEKYDDLKHRDYKTFVKIPATLLTTSLSPEHIGIYTLLNVISGVSPYYEGRHAAMLQTNKGIAELIKWNGQVGETEKLVTDLQQNEKLELFRRNNSYDIVFPKITKESGMYITAYANPIRRIISKSRGKSMLTHLAAYVGMRSGIYEKSTSDRVFIKSPNYIAKVINMPVTTVRRQLKWLRDNDIIAYYLVRVTENLGFERYYYAEYKDAKLLKTVMEGYQKQGYVKDVLE